MILYSLLKAAIDSIVMWLTSNLGKGTPTIEADHKPEINRRAGGRIAEYVRRLRMQSSGPRDGGKSDSPGP